jgi:PIN domain nuclease of toxin-antitoxin system
MRALLDTNLLLWYLYAPHRFGKELVSKFADETITLCFSSASVWEVAIKHSLGRPDFTAHPKQMRDKLLDLGFDEILIDASHIYKTTLLAPIHRDPFDRLLVAQAIIEKMKLWTSDKTLADYGRQVRVYA